MANEHDRRYKKLFSHPVIVKELLLYFINEDFIKELDFSSLNRMDKTFITDEFKEKESDIIYKIYFKDQEIFIYLLIEFQSTVDKFMALRIGRYIIEFYEYLSHTLSVDQIPAAFPVLLYNGDAKWPACSNLQDLITPSIPKQYIPHFSYYGKRT